MPCIHAFLKFRWNGLPAQPAIMDLLWDHDLKRVDRNIFLVLDNFVVKIIFELNKVPIGLLNTSKAAMSSILFQNQFIEYSNNL